MIETKYKIDSPLRLKYYKGNIVAVITYNHKTFRYNLAKVPKECFLEKTVMLKQSNKLRNARDLADSISKQTQQLKEITDELIKSLSPGESLRKEMIERKMSLLSVPGIISTAQREGRKTFTEDYKYWLFEGKGSKRKPTTKKDFVSLYHFLLDFEYDNGSFSIDELNDDLLDSIIDYAYQTHESTNEHTYYTQGNLSNRTINKRLSSLYTFIKEFYRQDPQSIVEWRHLAEIEKKIIRLTRQELHLLEIIDVQEPELAKARDYFLFLCYTGLRFGDFAKLDQTYVDSDTNELVLLTNKTGKPCRIYLFDKAKEIGEKYNYHFAPVYNQVLNRQIKQLFEKYDLFGEDITVDFQSKERMTITRKKREFIGCHTGRRTFISMLAEDGMDIYTIMGASGHSTYQMVKKYIDLFGPERTNKFAVLNKKLNENYGK